MRFRTELKLTPSDLKITHSDPIMLIGSCFSTSIGQKMVDRKYHAKINPFGTLYHPHAIANCLATITERVDDQASDKYIVRLDDRYVHYDYHSALAAESKKELIEFIEQTKQQALEHLERSNVLFVTLGTAYHFYNKSLDHIVANCHKQSNDLFDRKLSTFDELIVDLQRLVESVRHMKTEMDIVFTVSPVRHIRDGLVANARSKSLLISAIHEVIQSETSLHYFPAYELMMDDLRDYRYYGSDLVHPNDQGVEYIWSYVQDSYMTEETVTLNKRILDVKNVVRHRPFHSESTAHQELLHRTLQEIENLEKDYDLNFGDVKSQLSGALL